MIRMVLLESLHRMHIVALKQILNPMPLLNSQYIGSITLDHVPAHCKAASANINAQPG